MVPAPDCAAMACKLQLPTTACPAFWLHSVIRRHIALDLHCSARLPAHQASSYGLRYEDTPSPDIASQLARAAGCGKSTFMRRMTGIFGGTPKAPEGGNPDSNTLLSDMTTVICLDDYHALDRNGRKVAKVTALAPEAQNFDLMYQQASTRATSRLFEKEACVSPVHGSNLPMVSASTVRLNIANCACVRGACASCMRQPAAVFCSRLAHAAPRP